MRTSHSLIIDLAALAVYLVAANPAATGLAVHEWAGLGIAVVFLVHCAMHCDWAADVVRRLGTSRTLATTGNLILDTVTLVAFMLVTVSGIMVSRHILPALGLVAQDYFYWSPLHSISAKALLALLVVHVAVHGKWLWGLVRNRGKKGGASRF
ncbi:MAG: DUF4405 domain-containing protein [Coriobacteriales bacterium]|nr:DUF4405 domain-containing protein [Coriobacteriales bacterium]